MPFEGNADSSVNGRCLRRVGSLGSSPVSAPSDQISPRLRRGRLAGGPSGFYREAYEQRNTVVRCSNRLKQWCGQAT